MSNNTTVGIERIIAKIDNDFNLDNSDWIPRVAAWCIDAMSQLDVLNKVKKRKRLEVHNRIAVNNCNIVDDDLEVYDENGCKVDRLEDKNCGCLYPAEEDNNSNKDDDCKTNGARTLEYGVEHPYNYVTEAVHTNDYDPRNWHATRTIQVQSPYSVKRGSHNNKDYGHNFTKLDDKRIELGFDTSFITIVNKEVETKYSDTYKIELPVIPDNGLLLEALAYYCVYKFLCRGYKHPVFNLSASQYGTNPYFEWIRLKDQAKRSVLNDKIDIDKASFRSYFFDSTFPKK